MYLEPSILTTTPSEWRTKKHLCVGRVRLIKQSLQQQVYGARLERDERHHFSHIPVVTEYRCKSRNTIESSFIWKKAQESKFSGNTFLLNFCLQIIFFLQMTFLLQIIFWGKNHIYHNTYILLHM